MNRCVILHRTGDSEVRDIQPVVHQQLRGLGYRRFVLKFVRTIDSRTLTGAIYSHTVPSPHQASNAAEQLLGRAPGTIQVFDDDGREVHGTPTPAIGVPQQLRPAPTTSLPTTAMPQPTIPGQEVSHERIEVKANDRAVVGQCTARPDLPLVRMHVESSQGWIIEVSTRTTDGRWTWKQVLVVPGEKNQESGIGP